MSFSQIPPLSDSLIFSQPPFKRRKISDPTQKVFEKTYKRPPESPDENKALLKRRKVETIPNTPHSEKKEAKPADVPSIHSLNRSSQLNRFVPRGINGNLFEPHINLDTPYKKYLAANLFHSTRPHEEKVLSFSSSKEKEKHPYDPSIHNLPFDPTQHKKCTVKKTNLLNDLQANLLYEPLAYNQRQDCFASIQNCSIVLTKGNITHTLISDPKYPPTAVTFNPEGTSLLVSLENGHLGSFDLYFDQHRIDSRLSWESEELSSLHFAQRNHLLISDTYIFVGTESGRICRISRSKSDEYKFYEMTGGRPILGLALSPDGQSLLTTTADGLITLFNVNNPNPVFQIQSIQIGVKGLAFSPCGRYFAAGDYGWDRRLVLFSIENQKIKEISSHKLGAQTTAVFWGKDYILSTHDDGMIRTFLVDPNNFSLTSPPKDHKTPFLGYQLAHAVLKRNEASDTLYVSCTATKEMIEVEIEAALKTHSKKLDSHFSKYTTIR